MYLLTRLCMLAVFAALAASPARAQHTPATVTVTGHVSAVVAVSGGSDARVLKGGARVSAGRVGAHTLVLSLSGLGDGETHIDIPVQLRSNVDFTLSASCEQSGAALSGLSVVGLDGAGRFVYPEAAGRVEVSAAFDGRGGSRTVGGWDLSSPVTLLSGPPISMSGTLDSPGNMLEVVLRVVLTTPVGARGRAAELKVSAAPRRK